MQTLLDFELFKTKIYQSEFIEVAQTNLSNSFATHRIVFVIFQFHQK